MGQGGGGDNGGMDVEVCDWCARRFNADDAFFDTCADPATGHSRLATACSESHLLALGRHGQAAARTWRRRLAPWRRRARPRMRVVADPAPFTQPSGDAEHAGTFERDV